MPQENINQMCPMSSGVSPKPCRISADGKKCVMCRKEMLDTPTPIPEGEKIDYSAPCTECGRKDVHDINCITEEVAASPQIEKCVDCHKLAMVSENPMFKCQAHTSVSVEAEWEKASVKIAIEAYKLTGHYAQFSECIYQGIKSLVSQVKKEENERCLTILEKAEDHLINNRNMQALQIIGDFRSQLDLETLTSDKE